MSPDGVFSALRAPLPPQFPSQSSGGLTPVTQQLSHINMGVRVGAEGKGAELSGEHLGSESPLSTLSPAAEQGCASPEHSPGLRNGLQRELDGTDSTTGQFGASSLDPWTVNILGHFLRVDSQGSSQCQGSSGALSLAFQRALRPGL